MQLIENPLPHLQFESWPQQGDLQYGVLTRKGGVSPAPFVSLNLSSSVADSETSLLENRKRAYGAFGRTTETLVHAHLIHDNGVSVVGTANQGQIVPQCDGIISNEPGCGLTMNFADCTPILVYDPVQRAIGLGHAGWKGAVADLPGALVRGMVAAFGSDPATLFAGIGPTISLKNYEVDEPLVSAVREAFPNDVDQLLVTPDGKKSAENGRVRPHFDLALANTLNLQRAGVINIEQPQLCTADRTDLFFSHRAEKGRTGRFGVVMVLND